MRVIRKPDIQALIRLSQVVSLDTLQQDDEYESYSLQAFLAAPEPPEDANVITSEDIFHKLMPGPERICIVLRADGYNLESIQAITGYPMEQIKHIFMAARDRLLAPAS